MPMGGNSAVSKRLNSILALGSSERRHEVEKGHATTLHSTGGQFLGGKGAAEAVIFFGSLGPVTPNKPQLKMNVRRVCCTPHPSTRTLGA